MKKSCKVVKLRNGQDALETRIKPTILRRRKVNPQNPSQSLTFEEKMALQIEEFKANRPTARDLKTLFS